MTPGAQDLILIIDDSVIAVRLLSGMVREQAATIFALNGRDGIALARERRPTLILLDVQMQTMDGYAVCRELKSDPELKDIAIIFVTGSADTASEVAALEAGAADFIVKPLNQAVVQARVRTQLQLQGALRSLARLARTDVLTGLYNRRFFDEQIEHEIARHRRQQLPLALAFVDIDCFKGYNDHYGHLEGDTCLARVGGLIEAATNRPGEVVARFGGEEFVALLPYTGLPAVIGYAGHLCQAVRNAAVPHAASSVGPIVTVSIGVVAAVPDAGLSARHLLARADAALYSAKTAGRDRVCALPIEVD
ncbi:MAG: diguanylate cyclase [Pseudomonadota bacterium]